MHLSATPAMRCLHTLLLLLFLLGLSYLLATPARAADFTPHLDLDVNLDPGRRTLAASATLDFQGPGLAFRLAPGLKATRLELDGRTRPLPEGPAGEIRLSLADAGPHRLRLAYQGSLAPLQALDHRQVLVNLAPMADEGGSFLPSGSGWYPDPGVPFSYRLRLVLPSGQQGLVPGTLVRETETAPAAVKKKRKAPGRAGGYRAEYLFAQAAEGIDLMAGPYQVSERLVPRPGQPPLRLRTWFYRDMADLATGYLDDSARYIERYSSLIGPYPFDAFSVVAAPIPTGFGMPSLTYLGRDVLRLPFIRATSLGHEVLHNWWGNGVIPDWATGNWSEGLTSFMADYAYKEDQSQDAARDARLAWLRNLAAVPEAEESPLTGFTARHHGISSIIGYDKAAMVFFMLRDEIGADAFHRGLRLFWQRHRFQRASWQDLEKAFAKASGRDLRGFFHQWVERAGAPRLAISQARWNPGVLEVGLEQSAPTYQLRVPLRLLVYPNQTELRLVEIEEASKRIHLPAPKLVQAVDLDPDYRLWRRLDPQLFPPTLREIFVAPSTGLVLATPEGDMARGGEALARRLLDARPEPVALDTVPPGQGPVLIIGQDGPLDALLSRLGLQPPSPVAGKGTARVWTDRDPGGRVYTVVAAADAQALEALQRPLPHYGRQSWLVFEGAKAVDKGVWPAATERTRVLPPLQLGPSSAPAKAVGRP